jgi:hypothetical protein
MREKLRIEEEKQHAPLKETISNIYTRLTDERYNAGLRKTGFLFFKPSDTGLYQTAVDKLKTLANDEVPTLGHQTEAKKAIRAYLDDRMTVRRHAYGRQRWEQMMCAYKALEDPEKFEEFCAQVNTRRGLTDPQKDAQNPDYVYASSFGPERVDLKNPHVPMNEMYRQLRQEYAKANAAGEKDALLKYFSQIAAMRMQSRRNDGDFGTLVDKNKMQVEAQLLYNDSGFRKILAGGDRKALFLEAENLLTPKKNANWTEKTAEQEMKNILEKKSLEKPKKKKEICC